LFLALKDLLTYLRICSGLAGDNSLVKMEPHQSVSAGRTRGGSGQLLDGGVGSVPVIDGDSSFTADVLAPAQRPSSLALSSAYFHRGGAYSRTLPLSVVILSLEQWFVAA